MDLSQRLANLSPQKRELLQKRLQSQAKSREPIAVVGMSCRFPGAPDLDAYWRLISEGIDATSDVPPSRWDVDKLYDPTGQTSGRMSVRRAGLVEDIDKFDPMFFGISPREAARMDPQQRLLLEVSWEACEVAGIPADRLAGTPVGVYVGIGGTDYSKLPSQYEGYYEYIDAHVGTGNALSIAANRISYIMDLRGPSLAIDTACSSSTMAIHLAIASLRANECDAALAGGVNAILTPETTIAFSKARMLSPDGQCRPFDEEANGYVRGEGCGMLVLKRLSDAVSNNDPIFGIIRASATNQDGRTSGITAPNGVSQQSVIRTALNEAGFAPSRVNYIEAHGTGTPLGDPIEIGALSQVFQAKSATDPPLYVTSVKANVGHMETVSGVAGMIKVLLMMRHRKIAPQLHLNKLNSRMSMKRSRLVIPQEPVDWPAKDSTFVAGVSSFGFGGANTHLILEEAKTVPPREKNAVDRSKHIVTLSAKTPEALTQVAQRLHAKLESEPELHCADIAFTLNSGRVHQPHRSALVFDSREMLQNKLETLVDGKRGPGIHRGTANGKRGPKVAFLFTGQGSQYPGMGKGLYDSQPVFREAMNQCDELLQPYLPKSLLSILYADQSPPEDSEVHQTRYTQPALFALEYSLAKLWMSWGVQPSVVMGHSVGEYVAACIAGVFSLEDGLKLIAHRGRLMNDLPAGGKMTVVFASLEVVQALLDEDATCELSVAAENGPENTVVAGDSSSMEAFLRRCENSGLQTQALQVSHAFHSSLMKPMLDEFREIASQCEYHSPKITLISNLDGGIQTKPTSAESLCQHVLQSVRFQTSMQTLQDSEAEVFLELGPSPILTGMGKRCLPKTDATFATSLRKGQDDESIVYDTLAQLEVIGVKIDWRGFDRPWRRLRLMLPTYPFQRQRHWLDPNTPSIVDTHLMSSSGAVLTRARKDQLHPLLGSVAPTALGATVYENELAANSPAFLAGHAVQGSVNLPAAGFLEIAFAAAEAKFGSGSHRVESLSIDQAMFLTKDAGRVVQTIVDDTNSVEIFSGDSRETEMRWARHVDAKLIPGTDSNAESVPETFRTVRDRAQTIEQHEDFYQIMLDRRLEYGEAFRMLGELCVSKTDALGRVDVPTSIENELKNYHLHPVLGDALFQTFSGLVPLHPDGSYSPYTYMPTAIGKATLYADPVGSLLTYAVRTSELDGLDPLRVQGDAWLFTEEGDVVAHLQDVEITRVGRVGTDGSSTSLAKATYEIQWQSVGSTETVSQSRLSEKTILICESAGGDPVASQLVSQLHDLDAKTLVLTHDADTTAEDGRRAFQEIVDGKTIDAVLFLPADSIDGSRVAENATEQSDRLMRTIQATAFEAGLSGSALGTFWVTNNAHRLEGDSEPVRLDQSPLRGMIRVAMLEHPELKAKWVDLSVADSRDESVGAIVDALCDDSLENQIAYRERVRYVARLASVDVDSKTGGSAVGGQDNVNADEESSRVKVPAGPYRLRFREAGSFDSLYFESHRQGPPGPGEVQLQVHAAGLNFSDVLKAMGLYPGITDSVVPLGIECSGVITAIGETVDRFKVGDEVMGVAPFSFGSHATTPEYTLVHRPASIDATDAAAIPIAFLTAWYGLSHLADLQPGERVLIHAGAGGVGLAATQIAQHLGAEVFATAGSDEKRGFLKACGVEHVFNSRTTEFADEIRRVTDGEGVDVVLNSLPGDAIAKSLGVLRAYGRFLEIGKTDIYQNRTIGLSPFRDNLSYFAIDLDRVLRQRPTKIRQLWGELQEHFAAGDLQPVACTEFGGDQIIDAFRYMAQRKNIGKVVAKLKVESPNAGKPDAGKLDAGNTDVETTEQPISHTVLITGGTGALGLKIAKHYLMHGHTHVALLARRKPDGLIQDQIDQLGEFGDVCVLQGDVADAGKLRESIDGLPGEFPPIGVVIHAAGVLDDGLLMEMTSERLRRVFAPKVQGAWNLHEATIDVPITQFVMFSSISGVLGSPGQSNYAAANSFLDGLAQFRESLGLPTSSIQWGPWAESGMAATDQRSEQLEARGMRLLPVSESLMLSQKLGQRSASNVAVMDVDWPKVLGSLRQPSPLLSHFAELDHASEATADEVDHEFIRELRGLDDGQQTDRLQGYFADELARLMGWDSEQIDIAQPLSDLGMDSLIAMELKNNLEQRLSITIPMAALVESPSITSLVSHVAGQFASGSSEDNALAASDKFDGILAYKSTGTRTPWLCVHPLGGNAACYRELAQNADADRPVHVINGRGSDGLSAPPASLDAMMDEYVSAVKERMVGQPIHLVGWSAGGVFAYDLAARIEKSGQEITTLTLIDTPLPSIYDEVDPDDDITFLVDFVRFSNQFTGADMQVTREQLQEIGDHGSRLELVLNEAKRNELMPSGASTDIIDRLVDASRQHVRFIKEYAPKPIQCELNLILPEETTALDEASKQDWQQHLKWESVMGDRVRRWKSPGDHFTMMVGDHAAQLAVQIERVLGDHALTK